MAKPTIRTDLIGGEKAAGDVWGLFSRSGKQLSMFHAAGMACGAYWEPITEARACVYNTSGFEAFRLLYGAVERGPLITYFTGMVGVRSWNFERVTLKECPFACLLVNELATLVRLGISLFGSV